MYWGVESEKRAASGVGIIVKRSPKKELYHTHVSAAEL
jgi:hypothetical protein